MAAEADLSKWAQNMSALPDLPDSDDDELDNEELRLLEAAVKKEEETEEVNVSEVAPKRIEESANSVVVIQRPGDNNEQVGVYGHEAFDSFDRIPIPRELRKGLIAMGFVRPSKIQAEALNALLVETPDVNMVAMARHGSGKTATFLLTILSKVDSDQQYCQAMCVLPTRELAIQVSQVCRNIAQFSNIKVRTAVPGKQISRVTEQILIGTPGRIYHEYIVKQNIDARRVSILVIDEADEMLSHGMASQMQQIRQGLPENIQVLLFSATFDEHVEAIASQLCPNPMRITVKRQEVHIDKIRQFVVRCNSPAEKFQALVELYATLQLGQSIIFVNRIEAAKFLYQGLMQENFSCSVIYGKSMDKQLRDKTMEDFRQGRTTVLISSDLLSRGIDVPAVTVVLNYDVPDARNPPTYVHRIGRSGRFGKKGVAITLVGDQNDLRNMNQIAQHYNMQDKLNWVQAGDEEAETQIQKYLT